MIKMIIFENIHSELYLSTISIAILFSLLYKVEKKTLIIIIVILLVSYSIYYYLYKLSDIREKSISNVKNTINEDIKGRKEVNEDLFYTKSFPTNLKYIKESPKLMSIVTNIRFIKKFNKSRYSDILLNMNSLMKVYIYILSERYSFQQIDLFIDLRDNTIELMHTLILIVPEYLKHTYGFNAHDEIDKSIEDFTILSREMLEVLKKYSKINLNEIYVPDDKYKPYNAIQRSSFP